MTFDSKTLLVNTSTRDEVAAAFVVSRSTAHVMAKIIGDAINNEESKHPTDETTPAPTLQLLEELSAVRDGLRGLTIEERRHVS